MSDPEPISVPLRTQLAIYGSGIFNFSMVPISGLIVALYVADITTSAALIGIVLGARHVLTMVFSIHGGILMDRLGTRRVMISFAFVAMIMPFLFPLTGWVYALILLQMIAGLADAMGWMGAQALSGRIMKGNAKYIGRMLFLVRLGSFVGPPLFGFIWQAFGAWPTFIAMSVWSAIGFVSVLMIPAPAPDSGAPQRHAVRLSDVLPRFSDYAAAFSLVAIPAITLVLLVTIARVGGTAIQTSFYVVYLESIALDATLIGFLIGAAGLFASVGSLASAPLARKIQPHWLVVIAVTITVVTISITPLLGGIAAVLFLVIGIRGACLGISQPIEISSLAQALDRGSQGMGVGLRTTVNRVAGTFMPPMMGGVAELVGIENSFFVIGIILMLLVVAATGLLACNPVLRSGNR